MQNFTRSNIRAMQAEMIEILNNYGFKNVSFDVGGASFSSAECTFKVKAKIEGVKTRGETELERHAAYDGLDINAVGPKGEKLIEYHGRKPKYPYIYTTVRGTRYKCSPEQAKRLFAA